MSVQLSAQLDGNVATEENVGPTGFPTRRSKLRDDRTPKLPLSDLLCGVRVLLKNVQPTSRSGFFFGASQWKPRVQL